MYTDYPITSGKYFDLNSDPRFPQTLPTGEWKNFESGNLRGPSGLYIYMLSGHDSFYIGSSIMINRIQNHRNDLNRNDHDNAYLQNVANKYGLGCFNFQVLIKVPEEYNPLRNEIENSYIKLFNTYQNGYNLREFADNSGPPKIPMSEKSRKKIADSFARNYVLISPEGITFKGSNVSEFARNQGLDIKGLASLVSENSDLISYKGWTVPYKSRTLKNEFVLVSPEGELLTIKKRDLRDFCKIHELNINSIKTTYYQDIPHKGWRRFNGKNNFPYQRSSKGIFKLRSPELVGYLGVNLKKFCQYFCLDYQIFRKLVRIGDPNGEFMGWTILKDKYQGLKEFKYSPWEDKMVLIDIKNEKEFLDKHIKPV